MANRTTGFLSTALLLLLVALSSNSRAQGDHDHELGEVNFPISCSDVAQREFNHAVTLLHHMTYPQAREVFAGIAEAEPTCAMGHWGLAMTLFQPLWPTRPSSADLIRGWEAVQLAQSVGTKTERETLFIAALEAFYRDPEEDAYWERIRRWERAMADLYEAYPSDIEAASFFALAHLATAPAGSLLHQERAAEILLDIHVENPKHPGASHYTIHANDVRGRESESLEVVQGYSRIAPRNPHALHMPTHIDVRRGLWPEAVQGNVLATDAALEQPAGPNGEYVWSEFAHAVGYMVYSYLQMGDDNAAAIQRERLFATTLPLQPDFKSAFHASSVPARIALEREAWEEAAELNPRPLSHLDWDRYWWPEAISWFAKGVGASHLGRTGEAADAHVTIVLLESAAREAGEEQFANEIHILRLELEAWIARSEGDNDRAESLLVEAASIELATPKQPITPAPILPAFEQLGDLYLETGRLVDALDAYESALYAAPSRFRSLVGAARSAVALGAEDVAERYYRQLVNSATSNSEREAVHEARRFLVGR